MFTCVAVRSGMDGPRVWAVRACLRLGLGNGYSTARRCQPFLILYISLEYLERLLGEFSPVLFGERSRQARKGGNHRANRGTRGDRTQGTPAESGGTVSLAANRSARS